MVEKHLGRDATNRLVLTKDKTLVHGNLLIDDKPHIQGAVKPRWKHPVRRALQPRRDRPPRITWSNWRNVLAGELARGGRLARFLRWVQPDDFRP